VTNTYSQVANGAPRAAPRCREGCQSPVYWWSRSSEETRRRPASVYEEVDRLYREWPSEILEEMARQVPASGQHLLRDRHRAGRARSLSFGRPDKPCHDVVFGRIAFRAHAENGLRPGLGGSQASAARRPGIS